MMSRAAGGGVVGGMVAGWRTKRRSATRAKFGELAETEGETQDTLERI